MAIILLIEDDVISARMVMKLLTNKGYTLYHVSSGMDGVKAARELRPTLILLDLGLPDLDGTLVAQQIRQFLKPEETLICAFTAQTGDKAKRLAHAYGCQQFISKPISTRIFPEQVMEMLKSIQSSVPADSAKPS